MRRHLFPVQRIGDRGRCDLRDPKSMPDALRAAQAAEEEGSRDDEQRVAQQRDDQRRDAHPQPFKRAAGYDRDRGDHKAEADRAQSGAPGCNRFGVLRKQPDQFGRDQPAQRGSHRHDAGRKRKRHTVDLLHARMLPRPVVITDDRAHALHDAVGRKVQKGLQLVVYAQHKNIDLRESGQDDVEAGDQQRRQRQVERRRYADRIHPFGQARLKRARVKAETDRQAPLQVADHIDHKAQGLADAGGERRALDAHFRERAQTKDQNRVQDDVGHAAGHHADHGEHHAADRLENLFHRHGGGNKNRKRKRHAGIAHAHIHDLCVRCKKPQKARHDGNAADCEQHAVQRVAHKALGRGGVRLLFFLRAKMVGDHGVGADGKADGHGIDQVLDRENERESRHGVLADSGDIVAVHDVIQRCDHHGQDHRQ